MVRDDGEVVQSGAKAKDCVIKEDKDQREFIVVGIAFTIFFAVISYNLMHASLWSDETIEYWYSKYFLGTLP